MDCWSTRQRRTHSTSTKFGDVLALVRLKEILKDKINEVDTKKISNSSYDNQNWAFRQAHTNGQLVTLKWIVEDLLPFVTDRTSK